MVSFCIKIPCTHQSALFEGLNSWMDRIFPRALEGSIITTAPLSAGDVASQLHGQLEAPGGETLLTFCFDRFCQDLWTLRRHCPPIYKPAFRLYHHASVRGSSKDEMDV